MRAGRRSSRTEKVNRNGEGRNRRSRLQVRCEEVNPSRVVLLVAAMASLLSAARSPMTASRRRGVGRRRRWGRRCCGCRRGARRAPARLIRRNCRSRCRSFYRASRHRCRVAAPVGARVRPAISFARIGRLIVALGSRRSARAARCARVVSRRSGGRRRSSGNRRSLKTTGRRQNLRSARRRSEVAPLRSEIPRPA